MKLRKVISKNEGLWLIEIARNAIQHLFEDATSLLELGNTYSLSLHQKRGVFVSLWLKHILRGCIGNPFPNSSLEASVQEFAIHAAQHDSRFPPLMAKELSFIEIEIALMSEPQPIELEDIRLGVHGIIVSKNEQMGLLLPTDALENKWSLETFLEKACVKGGLTKHAWQQGAELYGFEVQLIRENFVKSCLTDVNDFSKMI